jgi:hypothetical protein
MKTYIEMLIREQLRKVTIDNIDSLLFNMYSKIENQMYDWMLREREKLNKENNPEKEFILSFQFYTFMIFMDVLHQNLHPETKNNDPVITIGRLKEAFNNLEKLKKEEIKS